MQTIIKKWNHQYSCLISPYREFRRYARSEININSNFYEVYVKCSLETCIKRDPKGLYKKALSSEVKDLTGLQDSYEEPENPEVIINSEEQTPRTVLMSY